MAVVDRVLVGESLVGDGNEVAHIDLIMGPRGSAAEAAFCNCITNNKDGFSSLLAVVAPNLACKPNTVMFNKVTIKGSKQAVQMFGPAQRGVAMAVADSVEDGTIRRPKRTTSSFASACSSTGKPKTMPRSRTTTTKPPSSRFNAPWRGRRRHRKWWRRRVRSITRSRPIAERNPLSAR